MSTLQFLDRFPEELAAAFREAWTQIEEIIAQPHTEEAQEKLVNLLFDIAPELFSDEAVFKADDGSMVKLLDLPREVRKEIVDDLLDGVSRETQIAFNLTELMGHIYRETDDAESWSAAEIEQDENRLSIGGHQVMDAWETPIMHGMVESSLKHLVGTHKPKVLELGWGMGISGKHYVEKGVNYTVVEANKVIAEQARDTLGENGTVIESLWQDTSFEPGSFDIIFFDVYYTTHDQERDYLADVLDFFRPLLTENGILTYFLGNDELHIPKVLNHGYPRVLCEYIEGFEVPADCSYALPGMKKWLNILAFKN